MTDVFEWRHAVATALGVSWSRAPRMSDYAPASISFNGVRVTVTASGVVTVRNHGGIVEQWRGDLPEPVAFARAVRAYADGDNAPICALTGAP